MDMMVAEILLFPCLKYLNENGILLYYLDDRVENNLAILTIRCCTNMVILSKNGTNLRFYSFLRNKSVFAYTYYTTPVSKFSI